MTAPAINSADLFRDSEGVPVAASLDEPALESFAGSTLDVLSSYSPLFLAAFLVTLLATPIIRRIAVRYDVIDHPDEKRKVHRVPVAYLGGVAVFLGLIVAITMSYVVGDPLTRVYQSVPVAVVIGMVAITFTGLADDVWGWDPRLKIAGQLVAAAALAVDDVGVRVAESFLATIFGPASSPLFGTVENPFLIGGFELLNGHVFYWVGTALIAIFVLGGCNSANLIDGLDGLLSGVVGIVALGLLAICLLMIEPSADVTDTGGPVLTGARIVLCVALLGAVLGFLPHNFNPATIFLGDCGSLLLGYMCAVIILMLGDQGKTHLVFAGLIVFSVPIMDTILAIIRRLLAGVPLSAADDQHMHHQIKRGLGTVKRAVLAIYGIGFLFAVLGVSIAALVMKTDLRVRVIYVIAIVLYSWIGVIAVKEARRKQIMLATQSLPKPTPSAPATPSERDEDEAAGEAPLTKAGTSV
jgi:UDP-GlcNAc:undecaprenyl-phosphate GlcNAc-1-phosphate transferase